ncbi:MAG TPA: hypothetical protein PKE45_06160 [Caldilineaceae bacterium]|nr:hypothetical protein [Caldilineaceae bacterium]
MPDYITIREQEKLGLRRQAHSSNPVAAYTQNEITAPEQGVVHAALAAAGTVMAHRQMAHLAKSEDTALTNAWASLFYSVAYSLAGALITGGMLCLAFLLFGGDEAIYLLTWLVVWGICLLAALAYNRWQGLWFSPAGLDHHEIDSRERIAMHAIDQHIELIERRWGMKP